MADLEWDAERTKIARSSAKQLQLDHDKIGLPGDFLLGKT